MIKNQIWQSHKKQKTKHCVEPHPKFERRRAACAVDSLIVVLPDEAGERARSWVGVCTQGRRKRERMGGRGELFLKKKAQKRTQVLQKWWWDEVTIQIVIL